MDLSAFVGKRPEEQHGDVLRERIWVLSPGPDGDRGRRADGGWTGTSEANTRTRFRHASRTRTVDLLMRTVELAILKVKAQ